MSSGELAGRLTQRVTVERRGDAREASGGPSGGWSAVAVLWAEIAPDGAGDLVSGDALAAMPRWRVTLRAGSDAAPGDRIAWGEARLAVRGRLHDPAAKDRILLQCQEERS